MRSLLLLGWGVGLGLGDTLFFLGIMRHDDRRQRSPGLLQHREYEIDAKRHEYEAWKRLLHNYSARS